MKQKISTLLSALLLLLVLSGAVLAIVFILNQSETKEATGFTNEVPIFDDLENPFAFETAVKQGDLLFSEGQFESAIEEYLKALEVHPEHGELHLKVSQAYLKNHSIEEALLHAQKAIELVPNYLPYQIHLIHVFLENQQITEAKNLLSTLPQEDQGVLYYTGLIGVYEGDFEGGKSRLTEAALKTGSLPYEQIDAFLQDFQTVEAMIEGQDSYLQVLFAETLTHYEEYGLSILLTEKVLEATPNYRDAWTIQGYAYLQQGAYEESQNAFKEALHIDGNNGELYYYFGLSFYLDGEEEEAINQFERALLHGVEAHLAKDIYEKLAESYKEAEEYESALAAYEYLLLHEPESAEDFVDPVALAINELDDLKKAEEFAQQAVEAFPDEAMAYNLVGWVALEQEEYDRAEDALFQALEMDKNLVAAHYNLGRLYETLEDWEKAKEEYKTAYDLAPIGTALHQLSGEGYNRIIKFLESEE